MSLRDLAHLWWHMIRFLTLLGFLGAAGLLTLASLYPLSMGASQARESAARCQNIEVPVDEGYGISQVETRRVCER